MVSSFQDQRGTNASPKGSGKKGNKKARKTVSSSQDQRGSDASPKGSAQNDNDQPGSNSMTRVRGAALMRKIRKLTRENTRKIPLQVNPLGKPIGTSKSVFQSYIGQLVRERISIAYTNWKMVPKQMKMSVFDAILNVFDIPIDKMGKALMLGFIWYKWKTFKGNLQKLMKDKKTGNYLVVPPSDYPYISQDDWTAFVQYRCTKKFQDVSKANSEHSKKKKYHYKASSMGYDRIGEKILTAQNLDPETNLVGRAQLWKAARCEANGVYEDPETKKVADKIDMLLEQESQGIITPTGREDILALALETDEHPGRLRGVGFGVGVKKYFGSTKRTCSNSQQEINMLREKMEEMQKRMEAFEKLHKLMESQTSSHQPQMSPPASCEEQEFESPIIQRGSSMRNSPPKEPSELQDSTKKCKLAWPNRSCEVAYGRAFIPMAGQSTILHGKVLEANVWKVTIDTIIKENAKVPIPTEEVPFLSESAVGNIIAWPKDMIIFDTYLAGSSKGLRKALFQPKGQGKFQPPQCQHHAIEKCMSMIDPIEEFVLKINMPKVVVQRSHTLELRKEDVLSLLAHGQLDGVHISLYIKYLYDKYNPLLYKFACPLVVAFAAQTSKNLKLDFRVRYLVGCMRESKDCLWLVPYHEGYHWMLAVINPALNIVYWLDPLREGVRPYFKEMCETPLNMLNGKGKNLQEIHFMHIKCPQQYDNISCGLFVCRFMRDIVQAGVVEIPISYLPPSLETYNEKEIFEVIEESVQHLIPFLQLEVTSA